MQVETCVLLLAQISVLALAQNPINIGFIYSGSGQYVTAGVQPAVKLAVDNVNNRTDLLSGYQLNISYTGDSECDHDTSQEAFLTRELAKSTGPDNLVLLGCGCSLATEPIAEISQYWNLIHMSYGSSSDVLSNRNRFPYFWRTYPVESHHASSVLALMRQYDWKKIKIITQDELIFTTSTETVARTLRSNPVHNVTVNTTTINSEPITEPSYIFDAEARVYLLNMYPGQARRVFCAAARGKADKFEPQRNYGKYVWITLGWYAEDWWMGGATNDTINCTDADVEQFLPNTLAVLQANAAQNTSASTDVGLTADQFEVEYRRLIAGEDLTYEHSAFHAYDAIWSLAFAMNQTISNGSDLANYSRHNGDGIIKSIRAYLDDSNFNFIGVSGKVQFDVNGTRVGDEPKVLKYRDSQVTNNCGEQGSASIERVRVARVTRNSSIEYSVCENSNTIWPGGIPVDGSPVQQNVTVITALVGVYYSLATIGIIFAIICLFFNIIFRNRKIVKLISPNLNYAVILGALFIYASIYFYVFPSLNEFWVKFACHIRAWLQNIGFFLSYGTIICKVWRVHYIFSNPTVSKKKRSRIPKDWQLFLAVCVMLLGVAILLSCVAAFGKYGPKLVLDQEIPMRRNEDGIMVAYHNLVCDGPNSIIWIIVLFGFILLIQLVGVVLAFRTRKVEIKALNDYKYISALTYMGFALLFLMIVSAVALANFQNADAAVFSTLLFIFATICLGLSFIPKMVILYKDPNGERIFQRSMSQAGTIIAANIQEDDNTRYLELEQHCRDLEGRLAKCGEVVPTFRPRAESSFKLKSASFSSIPPSSPMHRNPAFSSMSAPSTPTRTTATQLNVGSSDYFTETERNSTSSSEPKDGANENV